jgi:hypothetical protein
MKAHTSFLILINTKQVAISRSHSNTLKVHHQLMLTISPNTIDTLIEVSNNWNIIKQWISLKNRILVSLSQWVLLLSPTPWVSLKDQAPERISRLPKHLHLFWEISLSSFGDGHHRTHISVFLHSLETEAKTLISQLTKHLFAKEVVVYSCNSMCLTHCINPISHTLFSLDDGLKPLADEKSPWKIHSSCSLDPLSCWQTESWF